MKLSKREKVLMSQIEIMQSIIIQIMNDPTNTLYHTTARIHFELNNKLIARIKDDCR